MRVTHMIKILLDQPVDAVSHVAEVMRNDA